MRSGTCAEPRRELAAIRAAGRRRLVEVELAAVEAGEVGHAATERVEADQVCIERADARGERVHLALHLAADRLEVEALALDVARHGGAVERARDEATQLHARHEHQRRQRAAALAAAMIIVFGCFRSNWSTRPVRPDTICRFIAALTLFAAVKHARGRAPEGRSCVTHRSQRVSEGRQLPNGRPTVRVGRPEVDPSGWKLADYDGIDVRLANKQPFLKVIIDNV